MIGGNGLDHDPTVDIKGRPPEEELYIRWTQVSIKKMKNIIN